MSIRVEHVDKAVTRALNVIVLGRILQSIADKEIAIDALDPERRIASRDIRIDEPSVGCRRGKEAIGPIGSEYVHRPGVKVGRKEEKTMDVDPVSEALVDGATCGIIEGDHRISRISSQPPGPS